MEPTLDRMRFFQTTPNPIVGFENVTHTFIACLFVPTKTSKYGRVQTKVCGGTSLSSLLHCDEFNHAVARYYANRTVATKEFLSTDGALVRC